MRFTTWSTVTNVFIISTISTLLSLIPVANAIEIGFIFPTTGQTYQAGGSATVAWLVLGDKNALQDQVCYIYAENQTSTYTLKENWPILNSTISVTYPAPGNYRIYMDTEEFGGFYSGSFTLD